MRNTLIALALLFLLAKDAFSGQPLTRKTLRDSVFVSGDILRVPQLAFENGESTLQTGMRDSLVLLRDFMLQRTELFLEVGCHTDASGGDSLNMRLSEKRAKVIYDTLLRLGVPYQRLAWRGYGECCPLPAPKNAKGLSSAQQSARNRRTELKVLEVRRSMSDSVFAAGDVILLPWVLFHDSRLSPNMKDSLQRLCDFIQQHQELTFEVASHTDIRGSDRFNEKLSQMRAQSVVDVLINKGIYAPRLVAKGYGETKPLVYEKMIQAAFTKMEKEDLYQLNRRIELKILSNAKQGRH